MAALRQSLQKNPNKRQAVREWAEANGVDLKAKVGSQLSSGQPAQSTTPAQDTFDALTEAETQHVSRPSDMAELHRNGITGKGVTVAVIDSGISQHPDIADRIVAFRDFSGKRTVKRAPTDPKGHGTHVAGIIAGKGPEISGVAPEANLVGCRINSEQDAIQAIDWVIENREKYSIDVLNLSLGVPAPANPADDKFRQAAERAVAAGLIVVAAAGNECKGVVCESTISSPGISPKVITVGALDDRGTAVRKDDGIYAMSSRGPAGGGKPDLIAEGVNVLAPLAKESAFAGGLSKTARYVALSGSSPATPMVSGAVALMLQVNPDLSHDEVKSILSSTAKTVRDVPRSAQGHGRLDLAGAVEAAKLRPRGA